MQIWAGGVPMVGVHMDHCPLGTCAGDHVQVDCRVKRVVAVPQHPVEGPQQLLDQAAPRRVRVRELQHPLEVLDAHKLGCDDAQHERGAGLRAAMSA